MTRVGTSLVDCGGADQCAETPIAPNEIAAIQIDGLFIVFSKLRGKSPSGAVRRSAQRPRAPHETTRALQWEQMVLMMFMARPTRQVFPARPVVFPKEIWIARRIEQTSGDRLSVNPGTLYPTLLKLEQERSITSKWGYPRMAAARAFIS